MKKRMGLMVLAAILIFFCCRALASCTSCNTAVPPNNVRTEVCAAAHLPAQHGHAIFR